MGGNDSRAADICHVVDGHGSRVDRLADSLDSESRSIDEDACKALRDRIEFVSKLE
jgi:hypothetical protein